jgi:hypothetical protein
MFVAKKCADRTLEEGGKRGDEMVIFKEGICAMSVHLSEEKEQGEKKTMTVYERLQKRIEEDVQALQALRKRGWLVWPMDLLVKEEEVGRCCFLAEEWLTGEQLRELKKRVGLDDRQWRKYKTRISH